MRSLLGLLIAPLGASLVLLLALAALDGRGALFFLPFMLVGTYSTALLLGVPAGFLLRRLNLMKLWHFATGGLILGLFPALFQWVLNYPPDSLQLTMLMAMFGALLGPLEASIFWVIAICRTGPTVRI